MDEKNQSSVNHRVEDHSPKPAGKTVAPSAVKRRMGDILRGLTYGGMAFLLSGCHLLFGTLPLGLALLCASSRYTWYILAGLMAGTLWGAFEGVGWVWISVYALAILLRLGILFFVDPPDLAPDEERQGERGGGTHGRGVVRQWASLKAMLSDGHFRRAGADREGTAPVPAEGEAGTGIPALAWASATTTNAVPPSGASPSATPRAPSRAIHKRLFNENPLLRIFTGSVCGFAAGLCGILLGGFAFYDLFAALFLTVSVPLAVFLFMPGFRGIGQAWLFTSSLHGVRQGRDNKRSIIRGVGSVGILLCAVIFAARDYSFFLGTPYITLQPAILLAILLTLGTSARGGLTSGVIVAALAGLAADPMVAPGLILCAVIYTALRLLSERVGVAGGCIALLVWSAVLGGSTEIMRYLFTCVVAVPMHMIGETLHRQLSTAPPVCTAGMMDFSDAAVRETREAEQTARLKAMSDAFSSLSRLFYDMSDRLRRPRVTDIHRLCEKTVTEICADCPRRMACREAHHELPDALAAHMTVRLRTHHAVTAEAIPPALRAGCPRLESMMTEINARCGEMTEQRLKGEKTEVFAADYAAMAAILEQAMAEGEAKEENYPCDHESADRIYALLTEQGLRVEGVVVCGKRERHIVVRGERLECLPDEKKAAVKAAMEEICGIRLSRPTFDVREGRTVMRLTAEPRLDVSYAGSTVPAGTAVGDVLPAALTGETAPGTYVPPYTCGDHIALFTGERAYFYALISDGMGSGEEASLTSDICAVFLEKMLSAGNRPEIALSMLGNFIRQKNTGTGGECSATVDLMELDLFCGDAVFLKNGAAPTYVIRGGTVYKLRSRTMPIGILKDAPPDTLRFRTHPGDVVVMVSDGVTHGNDECPWLIDLLSAPLPPSMDALRLNILNHAIASGSPDDLSAIAVKVSEK